jgi:hypothetical protein
VKDPRQEAVRRLNCIAFVEYARGISEMVGDVPALKPLLLVALGVRESPTVSELGEIIGEDIKVASRGVAQLRTRGWIKLVGDPHDTRKRRVRLTRAGELVLSQLHGAMVNTARRIERNFESASGTTSSVTPDRKK